MNAYFIHDILDTRAKITDLQCTTPTTLARVTINSTSHKYKYVYKYVHNYVCNFKYPESCRRGFAPFRNDIICLLLTKTAKTATFMEHGGRSGQSLTYIHTLPHICM